MSKEKILVINSKDKQSGTNGDFTLNFKADSSTQQVLKVLVKDIFVPNVFYNITTANNTIEIKQNAQANQLINIQIGQYNITQLITELKADIDAVLIDGATVAITQNPLTNILNFTISGATLPANNDFIIFLNGTTLRDIIGLSQDTLFGSSHDMNNPVNLNPLQYVQVHSSDIAYLHGLDKQRLISLIDTVSLSDAPFGSVAYKQNNDDELCEILYDEPRNLSNVKIVLRNEDGTKLILPENHHFSMTLKVYYD